MSGSRDVTELIVLSSTASPGVTVSRDITNPGHKGGHFIWRMSTNDRHSTGTTGFNVSMTLQGKITGTTEYYTVGVWTATTSATAGAVVKRLVLYPGVSTASTVANEVRSDLLPHTWRVRSTMSTSTGAAADASATYTVTAHLFD